MRPGIVLDAEPPLVGAEATYRYKAKDEVAQKKENRKENQNPSVNCFAAIMLGIKCEIEGIDESDKNKTPLVNNILNSVDCRPVDLLIK